jgi:hypothetical protein
MYIFHDFYFSRKVGEMADNLVFPFRNHYPNLPVPMYVSRSPYVHFLAEYVHYICIPKTKWQCIMSSAVSQSAVLDPLCNLLYVEAVFRQGV